MTANGHLPSIAMYVQIAASVRTGTSLVRCEPTTNTRFLNCAVAAATPVTSSPTWPTFSHSRDPAWLSKRDVALRLAADDEVAGDDDVAVEIDIDRRPERRHRRERGLGGPVGDRLRPARQNLCSGPGPASRP
jgi:hypothetical protein